jgi:putative exosortase-associated protein (TIGR04073 family)
MQRAIRDHESPFYTAGTGRVGRVGARRPGRTGLALFVGIFALLLVTPDLASAGQYNAGRKFRRGVSNMTLGVLAIPGQMTVKIREDGWLLGSTLGFAQGVGWFVATEVVGVWEFLTCPFELPPKFRPVLDPEFPWEYFEERNRGAGLP